MKFPFPFSGVFKGGLLAFTLLLLTACGAPGATAQAGLSYGKLIKRAELETRNGNYLAAADSYRSAYLLKPGNKETRYLAAKLYTRVRNYKKAGEAYELLEPDEQRWPLLGLEYGRALKQDGRYEQAQRQLGLFRQSYNGADRAIVTEIVNNELAGIRLARTSPEVPGSVDIERPGRGINTSADEFGPVAIAGDQLFFTSTAGGQSRLYQSRMQAREWTKATVPPGFPVIAEGGFGTGSFSPDGKAFFFTICSGLTGEDVTNRCEIFRGERSVSGAWNQPVALGPAVNLAGSNNAYPIATTDAGGRTLLYFASDRPGGRGGMDLYVSFQQNPNDPLSFSTPGNLGAVVNTVGDEVTPAYDQENNSLYFSSNGHPSFGGLDVFRVAGDYPEFSVPENLGEPVNSAADDYGLSLVAGSGRGYLVSNRTFENDKRNTTESDIYTLNFRGGRARLKAVIYDNTTSAELGGAVVSLLELLPDGVVEPLEERKFPTGVYAFDLRPGARYRVVIRRVGYLTTSYQVETDKAGSSLYGQPVFLRRDDRKTKDNGRARPQGQSGGGGQTLPGPRTTPRRPDIVTAPATVPPPRTRPQPRAAPPVTRPGAASATPAATAYRIQIIAERRFNPDAGKFEAVKSVGELRSEPIPGKNLLRITVGYYTNKADVRAALRRVHASGFSSAYPVRYDKGVRYGRVRI